MESRIQIQIMHIDETRKLRQRVEKDVKIEILLHQTETTAQFGENNNNKKRRNYNE